ncbi:MAG: hypothetical protein H0U67_01985 [Gemmatimonadetes bacterium]|nr:hypothetical protein [Gemmatimonadota bacterium]
MLHYARSPSLARLLSLSLPVLFIAACSELPQAPSDAALPPPGGVSVTLKPGNGLHGCTLIDHRGGGVESVRHAVTFPAAARHPDGATLRYRHRLVSSEGVLLRSAECTIPRTMAALEQTNRRFRVPEAQRRPKGRTADGGELSTQSCVDDGFCELDPIEGEVPPKEEEPGDEDPCRYDPYTPECGWAGDGGGGGGGGGSGGSGDEGGSAPDQAPEGIDQDEYDRMNETEKKMCWASPSECVQIIFAARHASSWAAQQTSEGAHNGPQDALRHAMWNEMTQRIGLEGANTWADAHELSSTDPAETRMGLHNNEVGRRIGFTWSDTAAGVTWAWHEGQLCLYKGDC